jgi:branched-chain amino acid transport system ATP-binding protein
MTATLDDAAAGATPAAGGAGEVLSTDGVTVRFSGLTALDHVSIAIPRGQVTGLIGPNGAGKSTLFNVICGLLTPNSGVVRLGDRDITRLRPHRRARLGIARTFQRLEVFGSLTVRENVLVAAEMRRRWWPERFRPADAVDAAIEAVGIGGLADRDAGSLPTGSARLVEVARALALSPRFVLLDEPSSGLDDEETDALGALLVRLAGEGVGVLLVEHDIPMVMGTCSQIHVLDFGQVIARGSATEIQDDPQVQAAYLGGKAAAS